MGFPPVSVVIPSYNRGRLLTQTIDSVLRQTVVPSEIIVVDDGSTDDTEARLVPYAGRIHYIRQDNQGVSAARNRGLRKASGQLIAFLDADDVWHPRKLEMQLAVFDGRPDLGLLGTGQFDWPTTAFPEVDPNDSGPLIPVTWWQLAVKNYLTTSSVVARRRVLDLAGDFDTKMQGPEDRDLWLRVAEVAPIAYLNRPLTGYRIVPGSVSQQAQVCQAGMLRILQKLDDRRSWRGRWLVRRKAYSYVYHACSYLHSLQKRYPTALAFALKSLVWYPIPFRRGELTPCERPRRAAVIFLRMLRLKPPEPAPGQSLADGSPDILAAMNVDEPSHSLEVVQ
ncbi:glycosyltransferase family 2 protein [Paludisphaera borealis]|uniref:GT2 family glycosyltransferase n=1 Tax=Paludisphaera borealis TaxID=1387353 RepID=A0A1U7CLW5_9BACT|nr:glycosyltransferase family A protein [Paludisphaera borealis]APW59898.1 GT2 family glycosyltransferase [Paludisphaera borealis]